MTDINSAKVRALEIEFLSLCVEYELPREYAKSIIDSIQKISTKKKQQILRYQMVKITSNNTICQELAEIIELRDKVIQKLKSQLQNNQKNKKKVQLELVCSQMANLRQITLEIIQKLINWQDNESQDQNFIHRTQYTKKILFKLKNDISFIPQSPLKRYIQFSNSNDPLFLYQLQNSWKLSSGNSNITPIVNLFQVSQSFMERLENADQFIKQKLKNQNKQDNYESIENNPTSKQANTHGQYELPKIKYYQQSGNKSKRQDTNYQFRPLINQQQKNRQLLYDSKLYPQIVENESYKPIKVEKVSQSKPRIKLNSTIQQNYSPNHDNNQLASSKYHMPIFKYKKSYPSENLQKQIYSKQISSNSTQKSYRMRFARSINDNIQSDQLDTQDNQKKNDKNRQKSNSSKNKSDKFKIFNFRIAQEDIKNQRYGKSKIFKIQDDEDQQNKKINQKRLIPQSIIQQEATNRYMVIEQDNIDKLKKLKRLKNLGKITTPRSKNKIENSSLLSPKQKNLNNKIPIEIIGNNQRYFGTLEVDQYQSKYPSDKYAKKINDKKKTAEVSLQTYNHLGQQEQNEHNAEKKVYQAKSKNQTYQFKSNEDKNKQYTKEKKQTNKIEDKINNQKQKQFNKFRNDKFHILNQFNQSIRPKSKGGRNIQPTQLSKIYQSSIHQNVNNSRFSNSNLFNELNHQNDKIQSLEVSGYQDKDNKIDKINNPFSKYKKINQINQQQTPKINKTNISLNGNPNQNSNINTINSKPNDKISNLNNNHNNNLNPNLKSNPNPDLNPNINPNSNPNLNSKLNSSLNPNSNPNINLNYSSNSIPNAYSNSNINPNSNLNSMPNSKSKEFDQPSEINEKKSQIPRQLQKYQKIQQNVQSPPKKNIEIQQQLSPEQSKISNKQKGQQNQNNPQKTKTQLVFKSAPFSNSQLPKFLSTHFPNSQQLFTSYLNLGYFKNRQICVTTCYLGQQLASITVTHSKFENSQRYLYILLFKISNIKYDTWQIKLFPTTLKYILSNDPSFKIIYLVHKKLNKDQTINTIKNSLYFQSTIKNTIQCQVINQQSLLLSRKNIQCKYQLEYDSILSLNMIFCGKGDPQLAGPKSQIIFSPIFLAGIKQNFQKKTNLEKFLSIQQFSEFVQEKQLQPIPKSIHKSISSGNSIFSRNFLYAQDFQSVRYQFVSNLLFCTIEPPYSYYYQFQQSCLLLLKSQQKDQYYIFLGTLYEEAHSDVLSHYHSKIQGKKIDILFPKSQQYRNKIITIPTFQKKILIRLGQDLCNFKISLRWKQYLKGVRTVDQTAIESEFIAPFYCGLIQVNSLGIMNHLMIAQITPQNQDCI